MDGPPAAACADYRRKLPWASVTELRGRQEQDAEELRRTREEWAGSADVVTYRCEVDSRGSICFVDLVGDARNHLHPVLQRRST